MKRSVHLSTWYTARAVSKASSRHTFLKCLSVKSDIAYSTTSPMRRHKKTEIKVPFKAWYPVVQSSVYQSCWAAGDKLSRDLPPHRTPSEEVKQASVGRAVFG